MEIEKEKLTLNDEKKPSPKKQKSKFHPIDYPLVIKAHEGFLTFSVPDFHFFKVVDMPKGQLDSKYLMMVAQTVAKCWLKTQENLARLNEYEVKHPTPLLIKDALKKRKYKRFGVSKVAALLGKSEQTVRRLADSGQLKCQRSSKGTRYFLEKDILKFMEP